MPLMADKIMRTLYIVAFLLSQFLLLVTGTPRFTNCPTDRLCVSVPVTYQCSVNTSGLANALQWSVLDATGGMLGDAVTYGSTASVGTPGLIVTQFTTNLTSIGGSSIVSDITFSPTMDTNNYTVQCRGINANNLVLVGTDTCSIVIRGILPAPLPDQLTANSNYYSFSWTPQPSSPCFSNYLVFVNSSVSNVTYTTTDTSLSLPVPSTNDTDYSISVVAVDTGGRYMNSVGMRMFTPDVPQAVTNLTLSQTFPDEDDDTVNITVSWNEPPSSSRPIVSDYIIYHNVPDPDSTTVSNSTTMYIIPDATVGSVYTVGVAASNVLGAGRNASSIISIMSTSVPPPTSTLMSMTMSPSVTSSPPVTNMSTSTQSTPATTPTTSSPSAGGLSSTVYIGIGAGVAVIVIVILILIVVGYLVWRKSKGEKANFDQRRDSTEPIALVDKKDHGSSPATGQPIYQEAMSSEDIKREAAPTTGELYAQPTKGSVRRPPPQPQSELATYQDPSTIQRTQAPTMEYLYAEVDKSKPQQQQAVYAQVDKEKKGGDGTVYADLDLKNTQGGPVAGNNPANVIYSDVHNN